MGACIVFYLCDLCYWFHEGPSCAQQGVASQWARAGQIALRFERLRLQQYQKQHCNEICDCLVPCIIPASGRFQRLVPRAAAANLARCPQRVC